MTRSDFIARLGIGGLYAVIEILVDGIIYIGIFVLGLDISMCREYRCHYPVFSLAVPLWLISVPVVVLATAALTLFARRLPIWAVGLIGVGTTLALGAGLLMLERFSL